MTQQIVVGHVHRSVVSYAAKKGLAYFS